MKTSHAGKYTEPIGSGTLVHLFRLFALAGTAHRRTRAPTVEHVTLPANGWRSIHRPAGLSIRCHRGRVVITQEGDPRDFLLVAGESYDVTRNAHLYVQAERDAELLFAPKKLASKWL